MIPKMNISFLNIEELVDTLSWSLFEDKGVLPLHDSTIELYPGLETIYQKYKDDLDNDNIYNEIKEIILKDYSDFITNNSNMTDELTILWNKYNDKIHNTFRDMFNTKLDRNNIIVKVGMVPVCPRYIEEYMFYVIPASDDFFLETCIHEICHFYFFQKCKELFNNWSYDDFNIPSLLYYVSEIMIDVFLNDDRIQKVYKHEFKAYDSFYDMKINDKFLIDIVRDIYKNNSIEDSIKKTYQFFKENENTLRIIFQ